MKLLLALLLLVLLVLLVTGGLVLFTWRVVRRVEAALPPPGRFVDVPGARLHVVDQAPAQAGKERPALPTLLLIHGLAGNLGNFTYGMVDRLAAQYRVVAVDRPGSGWSARARGASATLYAQADAMAALIEQLGLGRVVVVGHSLGGALALALAQRHPARVAALALVAPLTQAPPALPRAFAGIDIAAPWLRRLAAWTLAVPLGMAQRDKLLGLVFGPEPVPADFATRGLGLLGLRPSHFVAACTDLAAVAHDLPAMNERYGAMTLPVQVLYGRGDRILDAAEQGRGLTDKLPGARLVLVDGGHMLPVTQPERTADFVRAVAQGVLPRGAG